jgi:hypothetical protein
MYNITLRRVHATTVEVDKQQVLDIPTLCVLVAFRYPEWNAHAPYFKPWPAWLYSIFPRCLKSGTIFERKKMLN